MNYGYSEDGFILEFGEKNSNTSFELQVWALKKTPSEKDWQAFAALHAPHVKLLPVTADMLQVT